MWLSILTLGALSALSLRVFSEDLTLAGRQAEEKKKKGKFKPDEDVTKETPVPEEAVHETETEGAESTPN
jgi:hypothetical protein